MGLRQLQHKTLRLRHNREQVFNNLQRNLHQQEIYLSDLLPEDMVEPNKGLLYHSIRDMVHDGC